MHFGPILYYKISRYMLMRIARMLAYGHRAWFECLLGLHATSATSENGRRIPLEIEIVCSMFTSIEDVLIFGICISISGEARESDDNFILVED